MAKRKNKVEASGATWLDTYADTVTLLMTFFVLLYSMSTLDEAKVRRISSAFNEVMTGQAADSILQYNLYDGEVPLVGGESKVESNEDSSVMSNKEQTLEEVKEFVEKSGLSDSITVLPDEKGISLQLKDSILFETGKAELKDNSKVILNQISSLIANLPNNIVVEGHTDNVPIRTHEYDSNWDLSSARATSVIKFFTEEKHLTGSRFSASGCGEYKPIAPNTSDENKAKNRRVNILIVSNNEE
jgi:chemotaxis protein MotB